MLTQKIKQLRKAKGISREDMAEHLGVSPGTYGKLERGETKLDMERLEIDVVDLLDSNSIIITYNDHDKTIKDNGISMNSTHYNDERTTKALEHTINHMEEEITSLRDNKKQLLVVIERLSQQK